jgi:AcrR family transcriptional regulator
MGRKSRGEERRETILAAFERCIARYGIDVPLEQIADEARIKRSMIRHYLGNRDELVDQVIARIAVGYPTLVAELLAAAVAGGVAGVLDALFPTNPSATDWDNVIMAVVNTAQGRYPQAKQRLAAMMEQLVATVADTLAQLFPQAEAGRRSQIAYALLCLVQTHESLLWLGLDPHYSAAARASALLLLDSLAHPAASELQR